MSTAVQAAGTRDGALKGWDTRGRGKAEQSTKEHQLSQLLAQAKGVWGEHNLWSKLADKGHIGKVEQFSKEEQKELKQISRGAGECKVGYCFMNAQRIATSNESNPKVQYVEGLVTVHGVPLDHAWIEYDGKVFDPTLTDLKGNPKGPSGQHGEYFGVTVPKDMIWKYQLQMKTYSPLSHSRQEEFQKAIWGDRATIKSAEAKPTYPADHIAGMKVPKGGSSCASCEYLAENKTDCTNTYFQKWNGSEVIPGKIDEYCSDWYVEKKDIEAGGPGSGRHPDPYREEQQKAVAAYLSGRKPLAEQSNGKYREIIMPWKDNTSGEYDPKAKGIKLVMKEGDPTPVAHGKWMDWPEANWGKERGIRDFDSLYPKLAIEERAKLETNEQLKNWSAHTYEYEKGKQSLDAAAEDSDSKGTLWNGIEITGFSGPEEEAVRAMLSRVPPELLFNVKKIECAPELGAKHGRFVRENKTVQFNPQNLQLRQRFGRGPGWLLHPELTVVHEVGHSIYDSFTPEQKQQWNDLSGWQKGWSEGQLPPYEEKRPGWGNEVSQWTHKPGIRWTRHYAERNPNEDFSDCFAFFLLNKAHQMAKTKRKFLEQLINDRVKKYPQAAIQSPTKAYVMTAGGPGSGRHPTGRKQKPLSDRAKRALESYNPATRAKQTVADANVSALAKLLGGQLTPDNKPFDILVGKTGIEVKTVFPDVKNDKITMHPESLARKNESAKELKLKSTMTVVVDERQNKGLYVKEGLGSFRLGSMEKVSIDGLKERLT